MNEDTGTGTSNDGYHDKDDDSDSSSSSSTDSGEEEVPLASLAVIQFCGKKRKKVESTTNNRDKSCSKKQPHRHQHLQQQQQQQQQQQLDSPQYRDNRRRAARRSTTDPRKSYLRESQQQQLQPPTGQYVHAHQGQTQTRTTYHPSNAHAALVAARAQQQQQLQEQQQQHFRENGSPARTSARPSWATPSYPLSPVAQQVYQQQQEQQQEEQHEGNSPSPQYRHQPHSYPEKQQAQGQAQMQGQGQQQPRFHSLGTAQNSLTQFETRDSMPQGSAGYLRHTVMHRQSGATRSGGQALGKQQQQQQQHRGPDIDSLVIYGQDNDDASSQNSGLSQQRLLKKRHRHKLGSSQRQGDKKNYPRRNPNKQNISIVGMPESLLQSSNAAAGAGAGGGGEGEGTKVKTRKSTSDNPYERRLARERMRGLVRLGHSKRRSATPRYDGVESVDGDSISQNGAGGGGDDRSFKIFPSSFGTRPSSEQTARAAVAVVEHPEQNPQQQQQQQKNWWDDIDTEEEERKTLKYAQPPQTGQQKNLQQRQMPRQQQRQNYHQQERKPIPRRDESTQGHDGRGGYDFGSLPATAVSLDESYGSDESMELNEAGDSTGNRDVVDAAANVVPRQKMQRPHLAHVSSPSNSGTMEPIFEEDGPIRVGEMDPPDATPPRNWYDSSGNSRQLPDVSPPHASGENLFNQYKINPVPDAQHNIGEGGSPSPRLGAPPAPISYYDRPDPHDPALGDALTNGHPGQRQQLQEHFDDPDIVIGQWDSDDGDEQDDDAVGERAAFPDGKYAAAAAAAAAAIAGESTESPTSVAAPPSSGSVATHRVTNRQTGASAEPRSVTPNSVLTDEMSTVAPTQQTHPSDETSSRTAPRSSPQTSLSSAGQGTAVDSTAAVAPTPVLSQREVERQERIEKAHAIRQRRLKEAREQGVDLLRLSPERPAESSLNGESVPLSPVAEFMEEGEPLSPVRREVGDGDDDGVVFRSPQSWSSPPHQSSDGFGEAALVTPDGQSPIRGLSHSSAGADWEPDEKPPTERDRRKGRASEDLKGRVIDLSSRSRSEKPAMSRVVNQDAQFGFIEAVAAVVIQTFIRRYLAFKTATARYEAALTVKDFVISSAQARREAREAEQAREAQTRKKILSKAQEQKQAQVQAPKQAGLEVEAKAKADAAISRQLAHARGLAQGQAGLRASAKEKLSENDAAAIKIQAAFRGWWVRDCLSVDNYCATLIQQVVRGYLRRMEYEFDYYRIVIVQSAVRRFLAKRRANEARPVATMTPAKAGEIPLVSTGFVSRVAPPQPAVVTASPRPEARTQSFVKKAPVVIETGGKGSLIQAWKQREAQAAQGGAMPNIVYRKSRFVERIEINAAEEQIRVTQQEATTIERTVKANGTDRQVELRPQPKDGVSDEYSDRNRDAAATKIQSVWRGYAAETTFMRKLASVLMVQSLARRWVTMRLVVPYMLAARSGHFDDDFDYANDYVEDYADDYEEDYAEEEESEVLNPSDVDPQVQEEDEEFSQPQPQPQPRATETVSKGSMVQAWKEREAKAQTTAGESTLQLNTSRATRNGRGGNSLLQAWQDREKRAIDIAKNPGQR